MSYQFWGAVLIIAAGPGAWFNRKVLSHKVLVWIGLISFPLYLWHWPLIPFDQILDDGYINEITRVCAIAAAFLLAWLIYRFIEKILRFSGHNNAKVICLMVLIPIVGTMEFYTYP